MQYIISTLERVAFLMKTSDLQMELNQCVKNGKSVMTSVICVCVSVIK